MNPTGTVVEVNEQAATNLMTQPVMPSGMTAEGLAPGASVHLQAQGATVRALTKGGMAKMQQQAQAQAQAQKQAQQQQKAYIQQQQKGLQIPTVANTVVNTAPNASMKVMVACPAGENDRLLTSFLTGLRSSLQRCVPGMGPGDQLNVDPDGDGPMPPVLVTIPEGVAPGQQFEVAIPQSALAATGTSESTTNPVGMTGTSCVTRD